MSATTAPRTRLQIRRTTLSNGIAVIGSENHTHESVVLRLNLRAGATYDTPENAGLASLTASGLTRGTRRRTYEAINEAVDAAGMGFGAGGGRHLVSISARCLREDLGLAIDLIADVARHPVFPEREIAELRGQVVTRLRQADNDTGAVADREFRELIYPVGHPYRLRISGYQDTVSRFTPEDLERFHASFYGPTGAFCVVAGHVDFEHVVAQLEGALGDWRATNPPEPPVGAPPGPAPQQREVEVPGKTQSDLVVGAPGIARNDPDYYALRMANLILGRLGFMGRLGEAVRDAKGLAYGIHSDLEANAGPGPWSIRAGVNPANVDTALDAIADELRHLRREGVTGDELLRGQRFSTGVLVLQLETNDGVAGVIQEIEFFNLGLDYLDRYPEIINRLTREQVGAAAARRLPAYEETVRVIAGPPRGTS
ncbi:MAG: insulinase family protein [Chloroflexi bacterium]|nr:insulinase family protein [Chloroflexota bacterium]